MVGPYLTHGLGQLQWKSCPLFESTSELIAAHVGERRQELVQQISMPHVQLKHFETRSQAALSRIGKLVDDPLHVLRRHFARHRVFIIEGYIAGRNGGPTTF